MERDLVSNWVKSMSVDVGICHTHPIQNLYESFQTRLIEALNVWSQALVVEEFTKDR